MSSEWIQTDVNYTAIMVMLTTHVHKNNSRTWQNRQESLALQEGTELKEGLPHFSIYRDKFSVNFNLNGPSE
jgi:hypothetical protein